MKILQEGKIPDTPKLWWHGLRFKCQNCSSLIEVEPGDDIEITLLDAYTDFYMHFGKPAIRRSPKTVRTKIKCAFCGESIECVDDFFRRDAEIFKGFKFS